MRTLVIALMSLLYACPIFAQPKIITSVAPIASMVSMLLRDQASVESILKITDGCPCHYYSKPSDLKKVKNADLVIYIDDDFDGFVAKLMRGKGNKVVKISSFKNLRLVHYHGHVNWHLWWDLVNVTVILQELSMILLNDFPELKTHINLNLQSALKDLSDISDFRVDAFKDLKDIILLDDEIEYFFLDKEVKKLYQSQYKSLHYMQALKEIILNSTNKCLVLGSDQDLKIAPQLSAKVVQINTKHYEKALLPNLFYKQYKDVIRQVEKCLRNANS